MIESKYPAYRVGKGIDIKFAPNIGTLSCNYGHVVRAFGTPSFSVENNDSFEGTETVSWHIEFQTGHTAILAEDREFGHVENSHETSKTWKINSRFPQTFEWIKQIIRDSNPNAH